MKLREQILAIGLAGAAVAALVGAVGLYSAGRLAAAFDGAVSMGLAVQNSQRAAMMHGAVRGDVQRAMLGAIGRDRAQIAEARRTAEVVTIVEGLAAQTSILALNAAVEAARAGDAGRGFAVVANEVRSLAQRSAQAAGEIDALIGASVEQAGQGSTLAAQAGAAMTDIVAGIRRVADIMGEISRASAEQSASMTEVGQAISEMDRVTQQNAALVEAMARAAGTLKAQADELVQAVNVFKGGEEQATVGRTPGTR